MMHEYLPLSAALAWWKKGSFRVYYYRQQSFSSNLIPSHLSFHLLSDLSLHFSSHLSSNLISHLISNLIFNLISNYISHLISPHHHKSIPAYLVSDCIASHFTSSILVSSPFLLSFLVSSHLV